METFITFPSFQQHLAIIRPKVPTFFLSLLFVFQDLDETINFVFQDLDETKDTEIDSMSTEQLNETNLLDMMEEEFEETLNLLNFMQQTIQTRDCK